MADEAQDTIADIDAYLRAHDADWGTIAENLTVAVDPTDLATWRDVLAMVTHQRDAARAALRPFAAAQVAQVTAGPGPPHPLAPYQATVTVEDFLRARAALAGEAGA